MNEYRGRVVRASLAVLSCALLSTTAIAHPPKPGWGKTHHAGAWNAPYHATGREPITSGTWTPLSTGFPGASPETALMMMNGTVIVHDACTSNWYRLTPDSKGQYVTGTWSQIGAMPSGYAPLYFASQVLPNGDIIMNGGEYNGSSCSPSWTTLGAYYNASKDKWTAVTAPSGWGNIGDAQSVVLKTGTYMLADCCNTNQALASISKKDAVTWTSTGTGKADDDDEEGWTLLPNGQVFTVDVWRTAGADSAAELYDPTSGSWSSTTTAPAIMSDPSSFELGPAVLLPNDSVFQVGTDPCAGTGCASHSATYDVASATWTAGPDLPKVGGDYYSTEDAPAVVLPDGNVLVQMSPAYACGSAFCSPSHFFEFNGKKWGQVSDPGQAPSDDSYEGRFLPLPTGQVLWTSDQGDIEVYTPAGTAKSSWLPTVTSAPSSISSGSSYSLKGKRMEGVADGGKYGDDAQMAENYPVVRITNSGTGDVCFATTVKYSANMAKFAVPASGCESGASTLQVVVNGLASAGTSVTVD